MVDSEECANIEAFDVRRHDQYTYFVIGGSHSAEAQRQLVNEHPTTYLFNYAKCEIYVALKTEEAKVLAWDHNTTRLQAEDVIDRTHQILPSRILGRRAEI